MSKSATTSPVGTPWERIRERGYFGMSNERGDPSEDVTDLDHDHSDRDERKRESEERERDADVKFKRRLSGPAWYTTPSGDSDSLASSVSTLTASASIASLPAGMGAASHPSQLHPHSHHQSFSSYHEAHSRNNDTYAHPRSGRHSPSSSDSEDGTGAVHMRRRKTYQRAAERMALPPLSMPPPGSHGPSLTKYRSNELISPYSSHGQSFTCGSLTKFTHFSLSDFRCSTLQPLWVRIDDDRWRYSCLYS